VRRSHSLLTLCCINHEGRIAYESFAEWDFISVRETADTDLRERDNE
jgi:hypothetical protein